MDNKAGYKPSIEIETILQLQQDALDSLFEVIGLSQEEIDRFNDILNKKWQDRIDTEKKVKELFLKLVAEKENAPLHA